MAITLISTRLLTTFETSSISCFVRYCVKYQIMATMALVMPPIQPSTTRLSKLMRCLMDTVMMPTMVAT
ncbi:hypothetical protein D3C72_1743160 [compost metagenome]